MSREDASHLRVLPWMVPSDLGRDVHPKHTPPSAPDIINT